MSYKPNYVKGDWKAICDQCGRIFKATLLRKRWDGYMVCDEDWEPRQPQDFVRGIADQQAPTWTRPEQQDQFIKGSLCGITESSATPGLAYPGCLIPSQKVPSWYEPVSPSTFTP